jgi:hypothetical protein
MRFWKFRFFSRSQNDQLVHEDMREGVNVAKLISSSLMVQISNLEHFVTVWAFLDKAHNCK